MSSLAELPKSQACGVEPAVTASGVGPQRRCFDEPGVANASSSPLTDCTLSALMIACMTKPATTQCLRFDVQRSAFTMVCICENSSVSADSQARRWPIGVTREGRSTEVAEFPQQKLKQI